MSEKWFLSVACVWWFCCRFLLTRKIQYLRIHRRHLRISLKILIRRHLLWIGSAIVFSMSSIPWFQMNNLPMVLKVLKMIINKCAFNCRVSFSKQNPPVFIRRIIFHAIFWGQKFFFSWIHTTWVILKYIFTSSHILISFSLNLNYLKILFIRISYSLPLIS